jgi:hypothetical protein
MKNVIWQYTCQRRSSAFKTSKSAIQQIVATVVVLPWFLFKTWFKNREGTAI